jgi:hypothetical protein
MIWPEADTALLRTDFCYAESGATWPLVQATESKLAPSKRDQVEVHKCTAFRHKGIVSCLDSKFRWV